MKIVVISASPRKTANTQIIMKYVNEYTNQKIQIQNLSISQMEKLNVIEDLMSSIMKQLKMLLET